MIAKLVPALTTPPALLKWIMALTIDAGDHKLVSIHAQSSTIIVSLRGVSFDENSNAFRGEVEQVDMAPELTALLSEFDDRVSHLSLAYVDEIQDKIDAFDLTAVLQDGSSLRIKDLYLSTDGGVSFRRQ